jgi:hypothetical protein
MPNILLHYCPGVMVKTNNPLAGTVPTLEASQGPHLHLIIHAVSCTHLLSNCHLGSEDTLLGKLLEMPSHLSEISAIIIYIPLE